ncbi:hypothetical protein TSAR_005134 [Trichomalopsis sarcophagae]|uniref:Uncharacterized protein n=1 Tax=Trichomalopsis sarcophagae TaxID=543379 RepID=A0A232EHE7_9HYME|nr:hypothetical protein TSAR_005134 [Trichomalopsis sarcophagae]
MAERKDYNSLSKKQKTRRLNKIYMSSLHKLLNRHSNSAATVNQGSSYSFIKSRPSFNETSHVFDPTNTIPESQYNLENVHDESDAHNFQVNDSDLMVNNNGIGNLSNVVEFESLNSLENNVISDNNSEHRQDSDNDSFIIAGDYPFNLKDFLREWAISFNVRDQAVT